MVSRFTWNSIYLYLRTTINKLLITLELGCVITTMKSSFKQPAHSRTELVAEVCGWGGPTREWDGMSKGEMPCPSPFPSPFPAAGRRAGLSPPWLQLLGEWALHLTLGITIELSLWQRHECASPKGLRARPCLSLAGCSIVWASWGQCWRVYLGGASAEELVGWPILKLRHYWGPDPGLQVVPPKHLLHL